MAPFVEQFLARCRALDWRDAPQNWVWYGENRDSYNEPLQSLVAPYAVYLYPSVYCNIEAICGKCYVYFSKEEHRNRTLDLGALRPLLDDMARIGVFHLTLLGGEPLAYPHLEQLLEHCRQHPFIVSMSSNGLLLTEAKADLLAAYLDRVQISLDGASPGVAEALKGRKTFAPSLRAIDRLVGRGVSTIVSYVLTPENSASPQLEAFVRLAADHGVRHVSFIQYYPSGDSSDFSRVLDARENERIRATVARMRETTGLSISHEDSFAFFATPPQSDSFELLETTTRGCDCGRTRVSVYPNGDVIPCDFLAKYDEFVVGNIFRESLRDIWRGSATLQKWRERGCRTIAAQPCSKCVYRELCGGACQAMAYLYTGDDSRPDPRCPVVRGATPTPEVESGTSASSDAP